MMEPEESAYRISTTALALVIGVWGLERLENDPVDHFQRKVGRQALEKQPTSVLQVLADLHSLLQYTRPVNRVSKALCAGSCLSYNEEDSRTDDALHELKRSNVQTVSRLLIAAFD